MMEDIFGIYFKTIAASIGRYFLFCSIILSLIHYYFQKYQPQKRISNPHNNGGKWKEEVFFSVTSLMVLGFVTVSLVVIKSKLGYGQIYKNINEYGWPYFFLSIVIAIFINDATFYFTHRLMHMPRFYKFFHKTHHRFKNPTVWSALSFNPLEAILSGAQLLFIALVLPMHPIAFFIFSSIGIMWNSVIHCGYEIFPKSSKNNFILKYLYTPTHHSFHHQFYNCNYGVYFNYWDKLFKTEKI